MRVTFLYFAAASAASMTEGQNLVTAAQVYADWGAGKDITPYYAADMVAEGSLGCVNSNLCNRWEGHAGLKQWIGMLASDFDFTTFNPEMSASGNKVFSYVTTAATNKHTGLEVGSTDMTQIMTFNEEGKISHIKGFFGNTPAWDNSYGNAATITDEMVGTWASGGDWTAFCSEDVVVDASAPGVTTSSGFKVYSGKKEAKDWTDFLKANIKFNNMVISPAAGRKGSATVTFSHNPEHNGKQAGATTWIVEFTANKVGKISHLKHYYADVTALNDLFAADPDAVATSMVTAWGQGEDLSPFFTEDCAVDVTGHHGLIAHAAYNKVYRGHAGLKEWVDFLATLKFIDFVPEVSAHGAHGAIMRNTYTTEFDGRTAKATGDIIHITTTGGRISEMKFLWSTPRATDAMLSGKEL